MSGSPFGIGEFIVGEKQADNTKQIAQDSNSLQWRMYDQTRTDQLPLIEAGQSAINRLSKMMEEGGSLYGTGKYGIDSYEQSDYNKWLIQQGINTILAGGSATGNLGSGNLGTALINYAQKAAGAGYNDWFNTQMASDTALYNRLMGIVNPSQVAASSVGSAGTNMASSVAGNSLYANMMANQYQSQGLAGWGNSSGQVGNQIMSAINAYNKANYLYDNQTGYAGTPMTGSEYDAMATEQSYGWSAYI